MTIRKILFILCFQDGGVSAVSNATVHLVESLALTMKWEIEVLSTDPIPSDQRERLQESSINITELPSDDRTQIFEAIKNSSASVVYAIRTKDVFPDLRPRKKFILDLHFDLKGWFLATNFEELLSSKFYRIFRDTVHDDLPEFLKGFKESLKEEQRSWTAAEFIIANSSVTHLACLQSISAQRVHLAPFASLKPLEYIQLGSDERFANFEGPREFRKCVHRLMRHQELQVDFYGLPTDKSEMILSPYRERFDQWLSNEELVARLSDYPYHLFASCFETFGLLLHECMLLGRICFVQKRNPGFELQVQDGINGFVIDFARTDWPSQVRQKLESQKSFLKDISLEARKSALLLQANNYRQTKILELLEDFRLRSP